MASKKITNSPTVKAVESKKAEELDFGSVTLPGLYIGDEINKSDTLMTAIGVLRECLKYKSLNDAREVLSSLPITISFDEIIELDLDWQHRQQILNPRAKTLQEAIAIAEKCVEKLLIASMTSEVIPPDTTSKSDYEDEILAQMIRTGKVIMLQGGTGVGKTQKARAAVKQAGINPDPAAGEFAYFSMPTLAPEDFVGIPSPDPNDDHLFHYRHLRAVSTAKVLMFDEINRAHPKIINGIMQLMLEFRINDQAFPNLKAIICACNPPEDGNFTGVDELDDAIRQRIDCFIDVKNRPDKGILARVLGKDGFSTEESDEIANILVNWWSELNDDQKKACNPRRLEKLGRLYIDNINVKYGIDERKCIMPVEKLMLMLSKIEFLNLQMLVSEPDRVEAMLNSPNQQEASDARFRLRELLQVMKARGLSKKFVKIAHLVNYLDRDMLPSMERDRSLMGFINRSLKKYATDEESERWHAAIEARIAGREALDSKIKKIASHLFESQNDPDAIPL